MYRALRFVLAAMLLLGTLLLASIGSTAFADSYPSTHPLCDQNSPLCTEVLHSLNYNGVYTGHDEPSLLFYSKHSGSGNNNLYQLTLPMDPPTLPKQDGTGGTFNFQLHPAFWFGMAMCDDQSAPNPGGSSVGPTVPCKPDSDKNIYDSSDLSAPDYIGKHPGSAFIEMQLYPPGWVPWPLGISCDPTKWCAALNIDSLSVNMNTGQVMNDTCAAITGLEYVNFAFITKDGKAQAPANPVESTPATFTPDPQKDLFMNSGDKLTVQLRDTPQGFEVVIRDLTTGESGSMTASAANGFGLVKFAPNPSTECTNIPSDFHPMYSTSSEHTRVPWAAHSYNIAFSDEIGHFEYCDQVNNDLFATCASSGPNDPPENVPFGDDAQCFDNADSLLIPISGCIGTDDDFDGVPYQLVWPGTFKAPGQDKKVHPTSILFTSPLFRSRGDDAHGDLQNFERVAFETDLPGIEFATNPPCNSSTGANCVNPPVGASFYPIYTTRKQDGNSCAWQLGGANIPGTKETFGGNSTAEYGPLLLLAYPDVGKVTTLYEDFRQILSNNPCQADENGDH